MGILSLTKKVGKERLVKACGKSLEYGIYNYMMVQNILDRGLDQMEEEQQEESIPSHKNIRGSNYYK
jgi:hypothetical protein